MKYYLFFVILFFALGCSGRVKNEGKIFENLIAVTNIEYSEHQPLVIVKLVGAKTASPLGDYSVMLNYNIGENGEPKDIKVERHSPYLDIDERLIEAYSKSKFYMQSLKDLNRSNQSVTISYSIRSKT